MNAQNAISAIDKALAGNSTATTVILRVSLALEKSTSNDEARQFVYAANRANCYEDVIRLARSARSHLEARVGIERLACV